MPRVLQICPHFPFYHTSFFKNPVFQQERQLFQKNNPYKGEGVSSDYSNLVFLSKQNSSEIHKVHQTEVREDWEESLAEQASSRHVL